MVAQRGDNVDIQHSSKFPPSREVFELERTNVGCHSEFSQSSGIQSFVAQLGIAAEHGTAQEQSVCREGRAWQSVVEDMTLGWPWVQCTLPAPLPTLTTQCAYVCDSLQPTQL